MKFFKKLFRKKEYEKFESKGESRDVGEGGLSDSQADSEKKSVTKSKESVSNVQTEVRAEKALDSNQENNEDDTDFDGKLGHTLWSGVAADTVSSEGSVTGEGKQRKKKKIRDPGKRQRLIFLAIVIVLGLFGLRVWRGPDWSVSMALIVAAGAAVLSYLGLIWALRFEVTQKGYLTVLPQPSLFVFSSILFLELFFFQEFNRIFEALIFGFVMVILAASYVGVFLTANILNVGTLKKIPLLQVAHTASYVISLCFIYFSSYALILTGIQLFWLLPILMIVNFIVVILHLSHFPFLWKNLLWLSIILSWGSAIAAAVFLFWPLDTRFVALVPTVVVYIGIGLIMHQQKKIIRPVVYWEYSLITLVVVLILLINAKWGIGGYLWM